MATPGYNTPKKFAVTFITYAGRGIEAGMATARSRSFKQLARKYGKLFLKVFTAVYVMALVLWLPLAALISLIDAISGTHMGTRLPTTFSLLCKVSEIMGPLLLLVLNWRSSGISDEFFYGQLKELDSGLGQKLVRMQYPPVHEMFKAGVNRYLTFAKGAFGIFIISLLPGGPTLRAILEAGYAYWLMKQVFGYASVSGVFAGLRLVPDEVWIATGLPIGSWHVTALVKLFMLARSVWRESLDPYLCRVRQAISKVPKAKDQRRPKCTEVDGVIMSSPLPEDLPGFLGFATPFALLMATPVFGPLAILFAQASAAHLVLPILTDDNRRNR